MRRISVIFAMALTIILVSAAAAFGQVGGIVIPIDTRIDAAPGSLTVIATVNTPPELVGQSCEGVAVAENGRSVHPNNNLILTSGTSETVLADVEGASYKVTPAAGAITLGETVTVTLEMGPHGIFSGGLAILIDVECTPPPTPEIAIVKSPTDGNEQVSFGADGIAEFKIQVTNTGPVPLTDVHVTDAAAIAVDPGSDCPKPVGVIGGLAVGESYTYTCTVGNLATQGDASPIFYNEATSIGTGPLPLETIVTATDDEPAFPVFDTVVTTTTAAPTTTTTAAPTTTTTTAAPTTTKATTTTLASSETLPVTGVASEQLQGLGVAGIALVLVGIVTLGGATLVGQYRKEN